MFCQCLKLACFITIRTVPDNMKRQIGTKNCINLAYSRLVLYKEAVNPINPIIPTAYEIAIESNRKYNESN